MAQNTQQGTVVAQGTGIQLQIPGQDQFDRLKFVQSETNPTDLVIKLPDESEIVIPNYIPLAQAGAAPDMTLEDGTVIPGTQIVSLIENLDYDKIATAAGDPGAGGQAGTGGGAGFIADPSGLLGDDIGHGPYAGGIEIADAVGFEQLPGRTDPDPDPDPDPEPEDLPFEAIDDYVIHNIQATDIPNPVFIPDAALRHNDIYPRGTWDLTSVENPGTGYPLSPPYPGAGEPDQFEDPLVSNSVITSDSRFDGTNTTSRFTGETTIQIPAFPDFIDTGIVGISNNSGEIYALLDLPSQTTQVDQVERENWDQARFILQTEAPGGDTPDWDGTRIFLYEGETIRMTPDSWQPENQNDYTPPVDADMVGSPGLRPIDNGSVWIHDTQYWMALDPDVDDQFAEGSDPLFDGLPGGPRFAWDHLELVETGEVNILEYTATEDGYVYLGIGNIPTLDRGGNPLPDQGTEDGMYRTLVEIDGVPYGQFQYTATDNVLSDNANVFIDAREEDLIDGGTRGMVDDIQGTKDDNIIISSDYNDNLHGLAGDDVLIGRGGDDFLWGDTEGDPSVVGRDLFLFENAATDGHDTIFDFNPLEGDIINLDILFDTLGIGAADREVLASESGGNTTLTIGDGSGAALASASDFSITLAGDTGIDLGQLQTDGNLVVDES